SGTGLSTSLRTRASDPTHHRERNHPMPDTHPTGDQLFPVRGDYASRAHVNQDGYRVRYERAARDPDAYWAEEARRIAWMKPPTKIRNATFNGAVSIKWLEDGTLNATVSCLDRHLATRGEQTAIIWEGDDPSACAHVTYRQLHEKVCRLAGAMRGL